MKFFLKILGVVVILLVAFFAARWAYYYSKYRQHLPRTEISVNGIDREYYLFLPSNEADGPSPLLVLLQGGGADAGWRFASQYDFEAVAEEAGMIIALPSGKRLEANEGAWQLNTDAESMQDIEFMEAMISDIGSKHSLDESRLYAVGYSLGSMFSYELACQMSGRFAAIASFAGTMPVAPKSCDPERNIPILHVHGVRDPIIAYGNTWDWKAWDSVGTMRDIPSLVHYWVDKYNCAEVAESATETITHFVYSACDQDSIVEHYRLENGTHDWPGDINGQPMHKVMWDFLQNHTLQ